MGKYDGVFELVIIVGFIIAILGVFGVLFAVPFVLN